jgi:hypothetical protein
VAVYTVNTYTYTLKTSLLDSTFSNGLSQISLVVTFNSPFTNFEVPTKSGYSVLSEWGKIKNSVSSTIPNLSSSYIIIEEGDIEFTANWIEDSLPTIKGTTYLLKQNELTIDVPSGDSTITIGFDPLSVINELTTLTDIQGLFNFTGLVSIPNFVLTVNPSGPTSLTEYDTIDGVYLNTFTGYFYIGYSINGVFSNSSEIDTSVSVTDIIIYYGRRVMTVTFFNSLTATQTPNYVFYNENITPSFPEITPVGGKDIYWNRTVFENVRDNIVVSLIIINTQKHSVSFYQDGVFIINLIQEDELDDTELVIDTTSLFWALTKPGYRFLGWSTDEMASFPHGRYKDQVDSVAAAFNLISKQITLTASAF